MEMPGCECSAPIVKPKSHAEGYCPSKAYQYHPLASLTSIRWLKLEIFTNTEHVCKRDFFSPLKGSLVTVDLTDEPSYTALSYTWGDPMIYYSKKSDILLWEDWACQCETIELDGQEVTIATNLYTALVALRYVKSAARYANSSNIQANAEYIWIDALCINQADLPEKSSQVQMMNRIYLQASHVVVWLGGADVDTHESMLILNQLTEMGLARRNEEGEFVGLELLPEMELNDPGFYDILGVRRHISPEEWSHIFSFLNRSWFRRAWVIQELGLAKRATIVCGLHVFNAAALYKWVRFLKTMHILPKIKALEAFIVAGGEVVLNDYWQNSKSGHLNDYMLYKSQAVTAWDTDMLSSLEYVRLQRIGSEKESLNNEDASPPLSVNLMLFRSAQATDPRDKIYAFLGISHKGIMALPPSPSPDYSISPGKVYTQWAEDLIPKDRHLFLLSQVEDCSLRKIKDLPSWVPDFSTEGLPKPFRMPAPLLFSADRGLGPMVARFPEPGVLEVRGYRLNEITSFAKVSHLEEGGIKAIADFLAPLPPMMMIKKPNAEFRPGQTEVDIESYLPQSRLDFYWRTLITDRFRDEHPARQECGQAMRISFRRVLSRNAASLVRDLVPGEGFVDKWEGKWKDVLEENAAWESLLLPDEVTPLNEQLAAAQSSTEPTTVFITGGPSPSIPEEYLDLGNNLPWDGRVEADYNLQKRRCQHKRKLIIIRPGGLGLAPKSVKVGDEIWILAGSQVPFVLRKVEGEQRRYRLIGEAYVHGIMHGEGMEGVEVERLGIRDILLV